MNAMDLSSLSGEVHMYVVYRHVRKSDGRVVYYGCGLTTNVGNMARHKKSKGH